jgi:hypothetical protein
VRLPCTFFMEHDKKNARQKKSLSCVFKSTRDKQIVCRVFYCVAHGKGQYTGPAPPASCESSISGSDG